MKFKELETFVEVSKTLNITKTAEMLNYSQSTLSDRIASLEEFLKTKLFERVNRTLLLTEDGKKFLDYAINLLELRDIAINDVKKGQKVIRVGITESLCTYKFPSIFRDFISIYGQVNINFVIARCEEIPNLLKEGKVDIGLSLDEEKDYKNLEKISLFFEELAFVIGANHDDKERVLKGDFDFLNLITSEGSTGYNLELKNYYQRNKIRPKSVLYLESIEGIKSYVKDGFGIGFLPLVSVKNEIDATELLRVKIKDYCYLNEVFLLKKEDRELSEDVKKLIMYIKSKFSD